MVDAVTAAKAGMMYDLMRLNATSENLTNATVPGYKRQIMETSQFSQMLKNSEQVAMPATAVDQTTMQSLAHARRDTTQGLMKQSGNRLDVALSKNAYIEVSTPDGTAYSRGGTLRLDEQGRLVTAKGYPVMSSTGEIRVVDQALDINTAGEVRQSDGTMSKLNISVFAEGEALHYQENGLFKAGEAQQPVANAKYQVLQGYVELSNVSQADEMVRMLEITRHFEMQQKVIKTYDGLMESAIQSLGDF